MRCLTDEQIEQLAVAPANATAAAAQRNHVTACAACRQRLKTAIDDRTLANDVRELRESREKVAPLIPADPTTLRPAR